MSYGEVLGVKSNGNIVGLGEIGSDCELKILEYLTIKYDLGELKIPKISEQRNQLLDFSKKDNFERKDKILLYFTLNYMLVRKNNLDKLITTLKTLNHYKTIRNLIDILNNDIKFKYNKEKIKYFCWNPTSVVDFWWQFARVENNSGGLKANIYEVEDKIWFLFDEL
mgnify:CR=1 FL=1